LYESLYRIEPPDGQARPWLLESGKMAEDALSWTFKLRDGIRFSNGDPMTAEDVKFSLDRYRSPVATSAQAGRFRSTIKDVVVVDRLTVRVELKQPIVTLPILLSDPNNEGIILPKKYIEQVGWAEFGRKPIGSGPYRLVEHKPGESITFEAIQDHWRADPIFAKIQIVQVPEERARIAMLLSGEADIIDVGIDGAKEAKKAGFRILQGEPYNWAVNFYGAYGDYPPNPLSKLAVRKALNLAVNKPEILDELAGGFGELSAYYMSAPGYSLGAPAGLAPTPYDPAEAKRLLQQAGYPDGFDLTFYAVGSGSCPDPSDLVAAVADYWQRIGVRTVIRPMDRAVYRPLWAGEKTQDQIVGTAGTDCAPARMTALQDLTIGDWSKGLYKLSDVADAEIEKALAAKSLDEEVRYSEQAYRKVYDNYVNVPIAYVPLLFASSNKFPGPPGDYTGAAGNASVWLARDRH
jgi:peptide/nickel transport system substrate-binding protein